MQSEPTSPSQETRRLDYLDSIRGIAALIVVICHCWQINSSDFQAAHHDLAVAFISFQDFIFYIFAKSREAGRSAVMAFFVLSGFVLAHSLIKKHTPYAGFVIKRVLRIYPAFAIVVLASYVLHSSIGLQHKVKSLWLAYEISPNLAPVMLLKNLALWSTEGSNGLDRVMWSLVHEMRISLLFPLILLTVQRFRWRSLLAYAAFSALCTVTLFEMTGSVALGYEEKTFSLTFLDTSYYVVFFACGAWLAIEREYIARALIKLPNGFLVLLMAIFAYGLIKDDFDNHTLAGCLNDYFRGMAATGIIALALAIPRFQAFLNHAIPVWLGRVSYSLYLVHCVVIYVVNQTFGKDWSVPEQAACVMVLSLTIAEIMARLIEQPSIRLGKFLVRRLYSGGAA